MGGKGRYYIQDESSTRGAKWVKKEKKPFVVGHFHACHLENLMRGKL